MDEQEIEILPLTRSEYLSTILRLTFKKKRIYVVIAIVILANLLIILANSHLELKGFYLYLIYYDLFLVCLFLLRLLQRYKKYAKGYKEKQEFISITQDGIKIRTSTGLKVESSWNLIREIKNEPKSLAIYMGKNKKAMAIPKRSFHSEIEAEQFISKMEEYRKKAKRP